MNWHALLNPEWWARTEGEVVGFCFTVLLIGAFVGSFIYRWFHRQKDAR